MKLKDLGQPNAIFSIKTNATSGFVTSCHTSIKNEVYESGSSDVIYLSKSENPVFDLETTEWWLKYLNDTFITKITNVDYNEFTFISKDKIHNYKEDLGIPYAGVHIDATKLIEAFSNHESYFKGANYDPSTNGVFKLLATKKRCILVHMELARLAYKFPSLISKTKKFFESNLNKKHGLTPHASLLYVAKRYNANLCSYLDSMATGVFYSLEKLIDTMYKVGLSGSVTAYTVNRELEFKSISELVDISRNEILISRVKALCMVDHLKTFTYRATYNGTDIGKNKLRLMNDDGDYKVVNSSNFKLKQ